MPESQKNTDHFGLNFSWWFHIYLWLGQIFLLNYSGMGLKHPKVTLYWDNINEIWQKATHLIIKCISYRVPAVLVRSSIRTIWTKRDSYTFFDISYEDFIKVKIKVFIFFWHFFIEHLLWKFVPTSQKKLFICFQNKFVLWINSSIFSKKWGQ